MNKRILIAADIHTHPVLAGNQQCIMQYVDVLCNLGFEVYFLYIDLSEGCFLTQETREFWGDHFFYYRTPILQTFLQKVRRRIERRYYSANLDAYYPIGLTQYVNRLNKEYKFDGLIVNYIWNSRLAECQIPVKALFTHDVFTERNEKLGSKDAWYSYPQSEEKKGISRFSEVLSIQDKETEWFRGLAPQSHIRTVYSSFRFVKQPILGNSNILFFSGGGKLNKDGIERFISDVWPLLRSSSDSKLKLLLGGGICSCFNHQEFGDDILLMGKFNNPDDFYALGDICINPVYNGSGLKIKTFEALAHGKLTIVDPHSALGVYQSDKAPIYRAKSPQEYVNLILKYMGNKNALLLKQQKCEEYINSLNAYIQNQYADLFSE